FALLGAGRLTGMIDGGAGVNTVVGANVNTSWASFDQALRQTDRMVPFDSPTSTISGVAAQDTLSLGSQPGFRTGEAMAYRAGELLNPVTNKYDKKPIGTLVAGSTYFVLVAAPDRAMRA